MNTLSPTSAPALLAPVAGTRPAWSHLEKALTAFVGGCFFIPLLAIGLQFFGGGSPALWLRIPPLAGFQEAIPVVPCSLRNVANAAYQEYVARKFDRTFALREALVRLCNEADLRLFGVARPISTPGRFHSLLETSYLDEYCLYRADDQCLQPLVDDIARLRDFCALRHTPLTVLITPSKPSLCPELIPSPWQRRYDPRPRCYDQFLPLLRAAGIHCVDGHALATQEKQRHPDRPVFPLGGTHWTETAALATTNALLADLAAQGLRVHPCADATVTLSHQPDGEDIDLMSLCNLLYPWTYPVTHVAVTPDPHPGTDRPTAVFVGGSFLNKVLDQLDASGQFSETEHYFYYRAKHGFHANGALHPVSQPVPPLDFAREVFAADCLVLEFNERVLFDPAYMRQFLSDALAHLPDADAPRAAFLYRSHRSYPWGERLSFVRGPGLIPSACLAGFSISRAEGTWTDGPEATVLLNPPVPDTDVVLEAEVGGAVLLPSPVPEQRVAIAVNGVPVGEWVFTADGIGKRAVTLPKALFARGAVALQFRPARPVSLAAFGRGNDRRERGLCIVSLQLHPEASPAR